MLTVRYGVLPRINTWRPQIEQHLSSALDVQVTLGDITADWSGLNPTLSISNLKVDDADGLPVLNVPNAFALVSWRSILAMDLQLARLEINGINLVAARREDGTLTLAGPAFDSLGPDRLELNSKVLAVSWLLKQGMIVVNGATLRWHDHQRQAPELVFSQVDIALTNGLFSHRLMVKASPPQAMGKTVELVMREDHVLGRLGRSADRSAEIYIEIDDLDPQAWAPWLDVPVLSGRYAARTWIDVQQGRLGQAVLDLAGKGIGVALVADQSPDFFADDAQVRVTGWLSDILPLTHSPLLVRSPDAAGLNMTVKASGVHVDSPLFEPSQVQLGRLDIAGHLSRTQDEQLSLAFSRFVVTSADLQASLQGSWHAGGDSAAGIADVTGTLAQLSLPSLYRYLPTTVPDEARLWLRDALVQGKVAQASLKLNGDLTHFPFNEPGAQGEFRMAGDFHGLSVDYAPAHDTVAGWPAIMGAEGSIMIDKMRFNALAVSGMLSGAKGDHIPLQRLEVKIRDMDLDQDTTIELETRAAAQTYLSVLQATPAAERVGVPLDTIRVAGDWVVPVDVSLNLARPDLMKVQGRVKITAGSLSMGQDPLKFDNIDGTVEFTEKDIRTADLRAKFLGGDATVQGSLSDTKMGMQLDGIISSAALRSFSDAPTLAALDGRTRYRARLSQNGKDGLDLLITSTLDGMAIALPAPLGKTAEQKLPLSVQWTSTRRRSDFRHQLTFKLGDAANGKFERFTSARSGPYFSRAAIGIGTTAELPESGMAVDVTLDKVVWDDWKGFVDQLAAAPDPSTKGVDILFPRTERIRLRSPFLAWSDINLTNVDIVTTQPEKDHWVAKLTSKETTGSVSWHQASGALAGRVVATISKLTIGDANASEEETPKVKSINEDQWADIPAVDLTIEDFTLYGSRLGELRLRGSNAERGERWTIEQLDIKNPFVTFSGKGLWRLKGAARGVRLDTQIEISDLGKLSAFMGYPERVNGGQGTITAQIDWGNFPWVFSYDTMGGTAEINFRNGVFVHVNSRSARLLELLSLQSLQRLFRLDFRPGNEFQDGFPWNEISGKFIINNGDVATKNLLVSSPITEVTLAGSSNLTKKTWDMQANVKPILDMSGAAIATGFAVNPLIGLGALVTQFLLRMPIEHVLTARYAVKGPWDDPQLTPLEDPVPTPTAPVPAGG